MITVMLNKHQPSLFEDSSVIDSGVIVYSGLTLIHHVLLYYFLSTMQLSVTAFISSLCEKKGF